MISSWIFQSNPKKFRLNQYLKDFYSTGRDIEYAITQKMYMNRIQIYDEVFIWRALGDGLSGVVARGMVTTTPVYEEDNGAEYWIQPIQPLIDWQARIKIEKPRLTLEEGMITKDQLRDEEALSNLLIFRFAARAMFSISDIEAKYIRRLWEDRKVTHELV